MLVLKDIIKDYVTGDTTVRALNGITLNFRESEFVAVLGPSGCGKTTLLNIIGGLDRYTSGELLINGKSTQKFTDPDWDTYRNHSIGFVFQSYNLIPHQTALSNVELALTLSGVSKKERHDRAVAALEKVGLKEQINKRPNQMSGGQMQRVAIARALINDPDIILADEPTGALDSETSLQVMEILKEISKDKLIIMVTHNPDLADKYANRVVRCLDGEVIGDTNPYEPTEEDLENEKTLARHEAEKGKKTSLSLSSAFNLSANNLITKKGRTFLTAFAGSIGIIGIALVLALSNGIQNYIAKVQQDMLLSYPVSVEKQAVDINSILSSFTGIGSSSSVKHSTTDKVYVNESLMKMINAFISQSSSNNLKDFKKYIGDNQSKFNDCCNDVIYNYSTTLNIYKEDTSNGVVQVNPSTVMSTFQNNSDTSKSLSSLSGINQNYSVWNELIGDKKMIQSQYDVIAGRLPERYNEVVLMVDSNNEINELVVYALGLKDQSKFSKDITKAIANGKQLNLSDGTSYSFDDIMKMKFKLVLSADHYAKDKKTGLWSDQSANQYFMKNLVDAGTELSIVGIVKPGKDNTLSTGTGGIGYTRDLMNYAIDQSAQKTVVKEQLANTAKDVITGYSFSNLSVNDFDLTDIDLSKIDLKYLDYTPFLSMLDDVDLSKTNLTDLSSVFNFKNMTKLQKQLMQGYLTDDQVLALKQAYVDTITAKCSLDNTMKALGYSTYDSPSSIYLYPKSFADKETMMDMIDYYNKQVESQGHAECKIQTTDYIGLIMNGVTKIVRIITYVLVAFVAISLVVSSIMIGIITYISVLERTKEIGILRSIGASKHDIAMVFNAETAVIGLSAGVIGIVVSLLLEIPVNLILKHLTAIPAAASLPFLGALLLIVISVTLTLIAGLIPARLASKRDPVEALRTE